MVKSKVHNVKELLVHSLGEEIEVVDQNTFILTAPGEHYGSIMLGLDVTVKKNNGKEEVLNLVAKLIPQSEVLKIAFDIFVTFKKEVFAYTKTIPTLIALQKEKNVPKNKILDVFPKCFGARVCLDENKNQVDEDGVLIFENLKLQGYKTEDRLIGFDLDSARIVVQDLAKFHAVPLGLKLLKPEVFKEKVLPALIHNNGLEQLPPEVGMAFHNSIMYGAHNISELEHLLERLQYIVDDAFKNPYVNRPPPNEPWGTMAHSDFWVSNTMLLRGNDGKPLKNKIVDLQIMRYASAVRDLVFFLFTSVTNSVLNEHIDEFIKLYYDTFVDTLNDLNIDLNPFSWNAYLAELNEVAPTEVYHILIMLKPICTEKGKVQSSLEDFQDSDWSCKDLLGPNHRRKLRDTVLALDKKGWL
ncbi:unnamed protein product [Brassicogethes aeneus]|uniref:CHK kinase-like domain-containing protein n=1 Tax=Brassicogethes aeneus TaxID=1431903 RepID=A0A9P0B1H6_BRAAE|nr:unnamed protein product [Brassicogethes aeneus]